MTQAQFYYKNENAPKPKGNRIGTCILIEYDGRYYQRLVRTVTYENTFWIPRPQHLIVPSCKTIGQLETIGTAIGKPYWTDDRGF